MTVERATKRFLLRFSYIGTRYRGLQRQIPRSLGVQEHTTIQAVLENALQTRLKLQHPIGIVLSSRTDKHVHAHLNTAHVDLPTSTRSEIDPLYVTNQVNRYLRKTENDIVLRETIPVPYWYNGRAMALRRRYVYRVGLRKNPSDYTTINHDLPLSQGKTHLLVDRRLNLDKVQQACEMLEGFHDFATFQSKSDDVRDSRKHIEEITFVPDHDSAHMCAYSELYTWWKFNVVARSFLYKQVRRMVSALLSLGANVITLDQVAEMLRTPHGDSWLRNIRLRHGHALFLVDIEYDTALFKEDVPPPLWRPPMPYLGKNKILPSKILFSPNKILISPNNHDGEPKKDDSDINEEDDH